MATSTDLVRNAADKEQVKSADRTLRLRRQQDLLDLQDVLRTQAGRRLLWRWLRRLDPKERLYETDPAVMAYKVAARDVAVMMENEIDEADPKAVLLMISEAKQREQAEAAVVEPKKKEKSEDE